MRLRGKWLCAAVSAVFAQHATLGMVISRRQRPSWITSGIEMPHGALSIVKVPSTAVVALTSGEPETNELHDSHATPGGNGWTVEFGT